jgi:hypothetical protein
MLGINFFEPGWLVFVIPLIPLKNDEGLAYTSQILYAYVKIMIAGKYPYPNIVLLV